MKDLDTSAPVITFEADASGKVHVIATNPDVMKELEDCSIPTNVMFTDDAVSSLFRPPQSHFEDYEEALRSHWFGDPTTGYSRLTEENIQFRSPDPNRMGKMPYAELLKDKEFCKKLSNLGEVDWDVSELLGHKKMENRDDEVESRLPTLAALNSMFSAADVELLQYKADMAKLNASRTRERQRIQHQVVQVKPQIKMDDFSGGGSFMASSSKTPLLPNVMLRRTSKHIIKQSKPEGGEISSTAAATAAASISHNTVIHEALKYLEKSKTSHRHPNEIKEAYKKLNKYPLTFVEKMNLINTTPKDLPGMLCMLDDLGLRFSKDLLDKFEEDCKSLFPPKRERSRRLTSESSTTG